MNSAGCFESSGWPDYSDISQCSYVASTADGMLYLLVVRAI